jgi:hypothetical protein
MANTLESNLTTNNQDEPLEVVDIGSDQINDPNEMTGMENLDQTRHHYLIEELENSDPDLDLDSKSDKMDNKKKSPIIEGKINYDWYENRLGEIEIDKMINEDMYYDTLCAINLSRSITPDRVNNLKAKAKKRYENTKRKFELR